VISNSVIWTSLCPLRYYNDFQRTPQKISKQAAAVLTRDIKLTISETLEIIRKHGVLQGTMSLW
jgi:hypothetical protein